MADDQEGGVPHHEMPELTRPHPETNDETLTRIVAEQADLYPHLNEARADEPGRRRSFVPRLVHWTVIAGTIGAVAGFVVALVLGAGVGQAVIWALSIAVVLGCTAPFVVVEEEDGWRRREIFDRARRRADEDQ